MPVVTLVVEGTYPVQAGGISTWADGLIRHNPQQLFEVVRIGPMMAPESQWRFSPPANVVAVTSVDEPPGWGQGGVSDWASRVTRQLSRPDLVHASGTGLAGAIGVAYAKLGVPFVVSEHASYVEMLQRGAFQLETGKTIERDDGEQVLSLFSRLRRECYRSADIVTSLYEERRTRQIKMGARRTRTRVIANGVKLPDPTVSVAENNREISLVFFGSIAREKDPLAFIGFVEALRRCSVPCSGALLGPLDCDARYRMQLFERLSQCEAVRWRGSAKPEFAFKHADALVLLSTTEAQPMAVLEAMSFGVPVFSLAVGDVARMVTGREYGAPAGVVAHSLRGLVAEVSGVVQNHDQLRLFGEAGRKRVKESFSVERMARDYFSVYSEVLGACGGYACAS